MQLSVGLILWKLIVNYCGSLGVVSGLLGCALSLQAVNLNACSPLDYACLGAELIGALMVLVGVALAFMPPSDQELRL